MSTSAQPIQPSDRGDDKGLNVVSIRVNPLATGVEAAKVLRSMADHFESLGNEPLHLTFEKGSAGLKPH